MVTLSISNQFPYQCLFVVSFSLIDTSLKNKRGICCGCAVHILIRLPGPFGGAAVPEPLALVAPAQHESIC